MAERLGGRELVLLSSQHWQPLAQALVSQFGECGTRARVVCGKDEPERWDVRLTWCFNWSPQFPLHG